MKISISDFLMYEKSKYQFSMINFRSYKFVRFRTVMLLLFFQFGTDKEEYYWTVKKGFLDKIDNRLNDQG